MKSTSTRVLTSSKGDIKIAAKLLAQGNLVAFPTETVYGLGANALSSESVSRIYKAKGRPSDNPLIVHIHAESALRTLVDNIPTTAQKLIDAFWPGPLTIILNLSHSSGLSPLVSAGLSSVGIRIPQNQLARDLIKESGVPIAAPSANSSGKPSPTSIDHVLEDLNGRISAVVDGGSCAVGVESTVVDCISRTDGGIVVCRPGGVTVEELKRVLGANMVRCHGEAVAIEEAPMAPGMKYTHYAPNAELWIVKNRSKMLDEVLSLTSAGKIVGVLATEELVNDLKTHLPGDRTVFRTCGKHLDFESIARDIYDSLRSFNHLDVDVILCEQFGDSTGEEGISYAVMNRVSKAASRII